MSRCVSILIVLCALCTLSVAAAPVVAEPVLLTGNEARPPKVFLDKGRPSGYLIEVMRYVERETGQSFKIELFPFVRAINMAKAGTAGIIGFSKTSERVETYDFGQEPMFNDDVIIVVAAGKEFAFAHPADLAGKTVGVSRGASYGEDYDQAVRAGVFTTLSGSHPAGQLAMLQRGRLDAVLLSGGRLALSQTLAADEARALTATERAPLSYSILPVPFARNPNYVAFAKSANQKELLAQIDKALKKGRGSGELQPILNRYTAELSN